MWFYNKLLLKLTILEIKNTRQFRAYDWSDLFIHEWLLSIEIFQKKNVNINHHSVTHMHQAKLYSITLYSNFSDWHFAHSQWYCLQVNAAGAHRYVNTATGYGFYSLTAASPYLNKSLLRYMVSYGVNGTQWVPVTNTYRRIEAGNSKYWPIHGTEMPLEPHMTRRAELVQSEVPLHTLLAGVLRPHHVTKQTE